MSALVSDELLRRQDRLTARRIQQARFRDADRSLDSVDLDFNKKMNRALIHDFATSRFIQQREDVLLLGPPGTGKSHLAQMSRLALMQTIFGTTAERPRRCARYLLPEAATAEQPLNPVGEAAVGTRNEAALAQEGFEQGWPVPDSRRVAWLSRSRQG